SSVVKRSKQHGPNGKRHRCCDGDSDKPKRIQIVFHSAMPPGGKEGSSQSSKCHETREEPTNGRVFLFGIEPQRPPRPESRRQYQRCQDEYAVQALQPPEKWNQEFG